MVQGACGGLKGVGRGWWIIDDVRDTVLVAHSAHEGLRTIVEVKEAGEALTVLQEASAELHGQ